MSKKNSSLQTTLKIFENLKKLFAWAPLLKYEDRRAYQDLISEVVVSLEPRDAIEWIFVREYVNSTWEIIRYHMYKTALMDSYIESQLGWSLRLPELSQTVEIETVLEMTAVTRPITGQEFEDLKEKRTRLMREGQASPYFSEGPRDYNAIYCNAIVDDPANARLNQIETRIRAEERRRDAALSKLAQYRSSGAGRARASSPSS